MKFKFDQRIKDYYYSANYFKKTSLIIKQKTPNNKITMQFFQNQSNVMLCGINEVLELLKTFTEFDQLMVEALDDGTIIEPGEPVLKISGPYYIFGYLEGIIDGILARRSSVATNCYQLIKAAKNKKVIFMADRADHYCNQQGDGYAAAIAQIKAQVTVAQQEWLLEQDKELVGTIPHSLIQNFNGDIIASLEAYNEVFPNDKLVALVDYDNDVINTSIKVAKHFGDKLYGVRVDTSINLIDKYFEHNKKLYFNNDIKGVNPMLIKILRKELDKLGYNHIKIIVSSGFDTKKINWFEQENTPVDIYGVGASLLKINIQFTGDAVKLNNDDVAKYGRKNKENPSLKTKT